MTKKQARERIVLEREPRTNASGIPGRWAVVELDAAGNLVRRHGWGMSRALALKRLRAIRARAEREA